MSDANADSETSEYSDLPSTKVTIGDAMQLEGLSPPHSRYFVKLIGYSNNRSVVVTHPMQDDKLLFIKEGDNYKVRGFSRLKTYEFQTNVLNVCLKPYPYLHLAFPREIKTMHMRSTLRVKLTLVCSIESQASSEKFTGTIVDMSISGARINSDRVCGQNGEEINISFRLTIDNEKHTFVVPSVIRNVRNEEDSTTGYPMVSHGVEFFQTVAIERLALQNFIYKTIAEE